ncbi:resuscitation-promoting factor [Georgenia halophila]|uniref:Resuscitation-promoting factor n=1 Tax=Georgenia halophila TaxID=620889 RepID=A0ABP8LSF5_9MICO
MSDTNVLGPPTDNTPSGRRGEGTTGNRRGLRWLLLGLVPVLIAASAVAAQAHKTVEVEVNGQARTVSTWAGSVDGLLADQNIEIGPHDLLAPGGDTALSDDAEIVVRTARQVTVEVDGEPRQIWTTAMTQSDIVSRQFESGRNVTLTASRSFDRTALELPLVIDGEAEVVADGETSRVQLEGSADVADALEAADVELNKKDHVDIASADDGTVQVIVTRVVNGERTETEPIDFETVERNDSSLYEGETRVVQEGAPGERTRTFATITVGGKERTSTLVSNEVTTEPVDRIIAVGTAERPAPEPEPAPAPSSPSPSESGSSSSGSSDSSSGSADSGGVSGGVWAALAQCESGGNPQAVSASGTYYGLYQFSISTWQSVGGTGLPTEASASEQTMRAQTLQARAGWGQWPHCASQLGLY